MEPLVQHQTLVLNPTEAVGEAPQAWLQSSITPSHHQQGQSRQPAGRAGLVPRALGRAVLPRRAGAVPEVWPLQAVQGEIKMLMAATQQVPAGVVVVPEETLTQVGLTQVARGERP